VGDKKMVLRIVEQMMAFEHGDHWKYGDDYLQHFGNMGTRSTPTTNADGANAA
jgi:hypothetical protein